MHSMNSIIRRILLTEMGRRIEVQILMGLVTSSLHLPKQNLLRMPSARALDALAAFTSKHLEKCSSKQQQRLNAKAFRLGECLRRFLIRRDHETLTSLTFLLYRNIGIDMEGHFPGRVIVSRCHFCHYYSPHLCAIASLMDSGVICGLFGGGQLVFHERITEGKDKCCCSLSLPEYLPTRKP